MAEAFVYSWRNIKTNKIYIGFHKGSKSDGYVCSSRTMLEDYEKSPEDFVRFIIAEGTTSDMSKLETKILQAVDAAHDTRFYNEHNGNGFYHLKGHSIETKEKIGAWQRGLKRPPLSPEHREKLRQAAFKRKREGRYGKLSEEGRKNLSVAMVEGAKRGWKTRKSFMSSNKSGHD